MIKVTTINEQPIYINHFCIEAILEYADSNTFIQFCSGKTCLVKEPPEVIMRLIEETFPVEALCGARN